MASMAGARIVDLFEQQSDKIRQQPAGLIRRLYRFD